MDQVAAITLLALALIVVLLGGLVFAWIRAGAHESAARRALEQAVARLHDDNLRLERELRQAMADQASAARIETEHRLGQLQQAFGGQLSQAAGASTEQLGLYGQAMQEHLREVSRGTQSALADVRATLEGRLQSLQAGNEAKLDQIRSTVDEKLQATLEARLGESFRLVSERLEQVHQGLGEMQTLAAGVGDLKRVLGNVKVRGTFGEAQLGGLIEQVLLPEQYAVNVATRPDSGERVEFAVRLPGRQGGEPVWLPIDAKFPAEDYERLQAAQEQGDPASVASAAQALESRIRLEARRIRDKYVAPPHTTDFAFLFVPSESLFAEVLRRPGLIDALNREYRIVVAGPSTLFAMLNTLQMGFRTLAIEQRSAEVWRLLGAVKTEFGRFGDWLVKVRDQVQTVSRSLDDADKRTRQMQRALKGVEELPAEESARMLPALARPDDADTP